MLAPEGAVLLGTAFKGADDFRELFPERQQVGFVYPKESGRNRTVTSEEAHEYSSHVKRPLIFWDNYPPLIMPITELFDRESNFDKPLVQRTEHWFSRNPLSAILCHQNPKQSAPDGARCRSSAFRFSALLHVLAMQATVSVSGRGLVALSAEMRRAAGSCPQDSPIAETMPEGILLRPVLTLPVEIYTPERVAEFDAAESDLSKVLAGPAAL